MNSPPRILVVDDNETNRDILCTRLGMQGYDLMQAADGEEALASARERHPDLILLDIMMPKIDGLEVCRRLKADTSLPYIAIILVTARADTRDIVAGLEAGADEYLTKPIDQTALVARVKSMLRIKELTDQVRIQAADLAVWNSTLEQRVAEQLSEIERMGRLKRFLSPQVAELILSSGDDRALDSHRRDVTVVFCDLRGFTAFAEAAEPEEVMSLLRDYHACIGALIHQFRGTLERFAGDGLMVMFNDPIPCADPCAQAVQMAVEMRAKVGALTAAWRRYGFDLGFGVGIAYGYATLGRIGFEGRFDYAAIGSVTNLAARLCSEAANGQILVDAKVQSAVEAIARIEPLGEVSLKGFPRPMQIYNVSSVSG
jgi:class 3 adenylate cyclase